MLYARLKKEWVLRGWSDGQRSVVNWKNGDEYQLGKEGFYVARWCDGKTDFSSMAFLPRHIALLNKFFELGIAEECNAGARLESGQEFRKAANPKISGIHWAVTGRCNLNCRHCYMDAPSGQYGEPTFRDTINLVNQFEEANILSVSLTGGEPFWREDLFDIIDLLNQKRIRLTDILTNGTLITNEKLMILKALMAQPIFRISFDGCGAHDRIRGAVGMESLVINTIRRIRAADFEVSVTTSVDQTNSHCMIKTYELMKELDIYAWGIGRPNNVGCWRGAKMVLPLEEMAELCESLMCRWIEDGRPFTIGLEAFYSCGKDGNTGRGINALESNSQDDYVCQSCREWPYLSPDGILLPCIGYCETDVVERMPNLLEIGLPDAWSEASFLRSLLDQKKSDVLARNPECAACEMLENCGGGCRACALVETGDILSKDPTACELFKNGYKRRFEEIAGIYRRSMGISV